MFPRTPSPIPPGPALMGQGRSMPASQFERSIDSVESTAPGGGGSGTVVLPLMLQQADSTHVNVVFGQVMGITPTNVATPLDVSGTDGTWSIWLDCTLDDTGMVTDALVDLGTSGVPSNVSDHAYILIGEADVASSLITAVRVSLLFSQSFAACGRDSSDPVTTPGIYTFFVA